LILRETRSHGSLEDNINRSLKICTAHQMYSGDEIGKNEMGGSCSTYGEMRYGYRVSVEKPEGEIPVGRPRRRLEDTIRIDVQEVGWGHGLDRAESEWGRWRALLNEVIKLRLIYNAGNFLNS